jgi:hypothetical protein
MLTKERVSEIEKMANIESADDLETAAQMAVAAAYPHGMHTPEDIDVSRCLNFRIQVRDFSDLRRCLLIIGGYNRFDGPKIAKAIADHFPVLDLGGRYDDVSAEIGRQGSPVLYLRGPSLAGDDEEETFFKRARMVAEETEADEARKIDDHHRPSFRMWWD